MRLLRASFSALLLLALLAPAVAVAAAPAHSRIVGEDVDTDFCGTGMTVHVSFRGVFNEWDDSLSGRALGL